MNIVINAQCPYEPLPDIKILETQGTALLNLLLCLGFDASQPPVADALVQLHHLKGSWLVLSPVHWQASHNNAAITAFGSELSIHESELKRLYEAYADYLKVDGVVLYYHDAYTWLISCPADVALSTKPVHQLLNQPLVAELAGLDSGMYWQKILTESQMFFATTENHWAVNGVWVWGGGAPLEKKSMKICADAQNIEMARLCSSQVSLYDASLRLKDYELLLIESPSSLSEVHQEQLKQMPASWYWNNVGYSKRKTHWFTRIWSALTHAN